MSLLRSLTSRWVTVDSLVFELRSVDAAALASVGHAYLEGIQVAATAGDDAAASDLAEELRRVGESEEAIAAAVAKMRSDSTQRMLRLHRQAVSTPQGLAAYQERMRAYACAAVVSVGRAARPLARVVPVVAAYELHPAGEPPESPDAERVRLVDVERPDDIDTAIVAHEAAGELPLWAIPPDAVEAVGFVAAQLAGGRAAVMAPFRTVPRDV